MCYYCCWTKPFSTVSALLPAVAVFTTLFCAMDRMLSQAWLMMATAAVCGTWPCSLQGPWCSGRLTSFLQMYPASAVAGKLSCTHGFTQYPFICCLHHLHAYCCCAAGRSRSSQLARWHSASPTPASLSTVCLIGVCRTVLSGL